VALWLFHGEKDDVVPVSFSQTFFKKLHKQKADVRYTEYPQAMHDSWVNAFKEPDFMMWLFTKHKK
jgi:predicted peptidase